MSLNHFFAFLAVVFLAACFVALTGLEAAFLGAGAYFFTFGA
jgi:hypothetical protein